MDITKRDKIIEWLFFVFLILFPFGQVLRIGSIHPIDIVAGLFLLLFLSGKFKVPSFHKYAKNFGYILLFSLVFSLTLFPLFKVFTGSLYFLRLVAYYCLFLVLWNGKIEKEKIFKSITVTLVFVAIFGFLQYFLYPDLTSFKAWGWDDHLLRMVGTFLDPTFIGILLAFGFLSSTSWYLEKKEKKYSLLAVFFLISVALTYSRASYLALMGGASALFFLRKSKKAFLVTFLLLLIAVFFIPKGIGEGLKLERLKSVYARLTNYQETVTIFEKSPLFGVGFDNLCFAKEKFLGKIDLVSHACSGSDSSLLLILATSGVVGFLAFIKLIREIGKQISRDVYGQVFIASALALFIHSFFSNSLFYPWVMGYMTILGAILKSN